MIRVGAVDIDTSHPRAFGAYFESSGKARYAAVYNEGFRDDDEVEGFVRMFDLDKKCDSLLELVESVDIGFIHSCNWDKHAQLAKPFIDAGKPVFIDKPIAGNPADCRYFEEVAEQGAVVLGSSSARYAEEVMALSGKKGGEAGDILNVFGSCGVDEFNYGIHIVEAIGGVVGTGAVSTQFVGKAQHENKKCETYFVRFENGVTAIYNNFSGQWQPFDITAMTSADTFSFRIDSSRIYGALLERIFDYMETGKNRLCPVKGLTESVRIMLAGRISREKGGVQVPLSSIPDDYAGFDGSKFEREYARKAKKLYST